MKTLYYKASHKQSYLKAAEFLGFDHEDLLPPTILAVRAGKIVGVLGTSFLYEPGNNGIRKLLAPIAGPLKVEVKGQPYFIGKKLVEAYEFEAQAIGLKAVWFYVDLNLEGWLSTVRKNPNWVEQGDDGKRVWFRRSFEQAEKVG